MPRSLTPPRFRSGIESFTGVDSLRDGTVVVAFGPERDDTLARLGTVDLASGKIDELPSESRLQAPAGAGTHAVARWAVGLARGLRWSPDGTRLAFAGEIGSQKGTWTVTPVDNVPHLISS